MSKRVVVAYSGGLDTSYCVAYLVDKGYEVATMAVDTGGFSAEELESLADRAKALGASEHRTLDAREEVFNRFAAYVVKGNVLRGGVYPLCVGAERVVQAEKLVEFAKEKNAEAICHGCTGAGNDQVRFDVAFRALDPSLEIIAPIREHELSREAEQSFLAERGMTLSAEKKKYSVNQGILGTTIGGGETHDSWQEVPDAAYVVTTSPQQAPEAGIELTLTFKKGLPVALDGKSRSSYEILMELNELGAAHGVGRGIHTGDTVLGIKGRIAFEAPGAATLIEAHRELEKIVLSKWQASIKDNLAQSYGMLLHEGQWFDPAMRDMEAFIDSSQRLVSGDVRLRLKRGGITVTGVRSENSLMHGKALYGEGSALWNARDAEGFCKIAGTQSTLAAQR